MSDQFRRLGDLLVHSGVITNLQLSVALAAQRTSSRRLGEILVQRGFTSEEQIAACLARQYGYPLADPAKAEPRPDALDAIKPDFALTFCVLPLRNDEDVFECIIADPIDVAATDSISRIVGKKVGLQVAPRSKLLAAIRGAYGLEEKVVPDSFTELASIPERFVGAEPRRRLGPVALFDARDRELNRDVTLSCVRAGSPQERAQFNLVQAAARATSPAVCAVHDWFEHAGHRWTVFERLEGETLEQILRTRGARSISQAAELTARIAEGVDALNEAGGRCGLICPANLLVRTNSALLAPFVEPPIEYTCPEAMLGQTGDAASDVFALGTLLWECVTGVNPHKPLREASQLVWRMPSEEDENIPNALAEVLSRCLDPQPNNRFASPVQLANALRSYNWSALVSSSTAVADASTDRDQLLASITETPEQERVPFWRRLFGGRSSGRAA